MRKTTKMKLGGILGAVAFLFVGGAFLATNETKAMAEDVTPTLTFKAGNVNFGDDVHTLFAVDAQNVGEAEVKVLLWTSAPTEYTIEAAEIILEDQGTVEINATTCLKYTYEGLGAHEMTKNLYACAYASVEGEACYSAPLKYSVLQYAYNKMGKTDATASTDPNYIDLLQAMLNYGGAVQTYTNQNTDRLANADYTYVKLTNAKFEDGFNKGLYLPNETVKIIPDDGYTLNATADGMFEKNDDGTVTLTVPAEYQDKIITENEFISNVAPSIEYQLNAAEDGYILNVVNGPYVGETKLTIPKTYDGIPVTEIAANAFAGSSITTIYYEGTAEEWAANVVINEGNDVINDAEKWFKTTINNEYTFADYTAGVQYADNEVHVLDEYVTITTTDCHFTSELRIYSSSTYDGYAIITSQFPITGISVNAGNKVDILNIYGCNDGEDWSREPVATISVTSTSYNDYSVDFGETTYKYLKLDVAGTQQVRIKEMTINAEGYVREVTDTEKVEAARDAFTLGFDAIDGATTKTLPTVSEEATIEWALADHANATLTDNVLITTNPNENTTITLTATFKVGEATATEEFTIALNHVLTDTEILDALVREFDLNFTELEGATSKILDETCGDASISWSEDHADVVVDGNVLTTTNPAEDTSFILTATFALNEARATKTFSIDLKHKEESADGDIIRAVLDSIELDFTEITGVAEKTLPAPTENGVTVTWSSNHANATVVGNVLTTTNPAEDTNVKLTVTVTLNEEQEAKEFEFTLKKDTTPTTLATFEFGANGTASHVDGSEKSSYSETVNGLTLNLNGGSKMYTGARDAKGNSCIKLGTGSAIGEFTFTVLADVTKVVLYVAGYKDNKAKVQINGGTTQTISTLSNNGEYTAIEVDTTTNKTISFATVSGGYRAMLNTIEFIGIA